MRGARRMDHRAPRVLRLHQNRNPTSSLTVRGTLVMLPVGL
jgi:hypothetical protein